MTTANPPSPTAPAGAKHPVSTHRSQAPGSSLAAVTALTRSSLISFVREPVAFIMTIFYPLLMLIILVTVQVALSWYGNEVATSTAREVAREVRSGSADSSAVAAAKADGEAYAHRVGGKALTEVSVDVVVVGNQVNVQVTGKSMDIIAGFAPKVQASVTSERETFRGDT